MLVKRNIQKKEKKTSQANLKKNEGVDFLRGKNNQKKSQSVLFSKGKRMNSFYTEDSNLYITPRQKSLLEKGVKLDFSTHKWDSLSARIVNQFEAQKRNNSSYLIESLQKRYALLEKEVADVSESFFRQFTLVRLWNMSIVGAILFGMVSMTFIYRYLGQGAAAGIAADTINPAVQNERMIAQIPSQSPIVLGAETEKSVSLSQPVLDFSKQPQVSESELVMADKKEFEKKAREMVKGYPIEDMLPYILEKDQKVAAFIISIARKESSWGQHVPVLNGQDCYNYWGYRGQRKLMGTGGHTCFNSRKDAVDTVAKRLKTLVIEQEKDTPSKLILWKCGSGCVGDAGEKKWISDVDMYFKKLDS